MKARRHNHRLEYGGRLIQQNIILPDDSPTAICKADPSLD